MIYYNSGSEIFIAIIHSGFIDELFLQVFTCCHLNRQSRTLDTLLEYFKNKIKTLLYYKPLILKTNNFVGKEN